MSHQETEAPIQPLQEAMKPLLLPEISVKLMLGATVKRDPPEVTVSFEGDAVLLHEKDYQLAVKVMERVKPKMPKFLSRTAVINAVIYAQQFMSEELFRPGSVRVLFYATLSKASAFYRCIMPLHALSQGNKCMAHAATGKFSRTAFEYDVVVFQIENSPFTQNFARTLQGMGKKVVYELDDAFDCLEPWHPQYASYGQPERQKSMIQMMGLADAVQVSTPWLKDHYEKYCRRVEVVPNMLELSAWPTADRLRKDGVFRIVWAGSPSHSGDLREVVPALELFARHHRDVKIVMFGQELRNTGIPDGQIEHIPWCEFEQYPFKLAAIDADIAIAPLADVPFNHGKSNLRILQMWATGYPTIASNVGPYRDAILDKDNGLLVGGAGEWTEALESIYQGREKRESIRSSGIKAVKAFDVSPNAGKIEAFYSSLGEGR
jgi:glycosyltransferase involved in cell wall biosynthesis